ncbi:hypothetical protein [Acinetobacter sp. YH16039]|uniref:hypothetical protein n=1 Tax=Acinetobacter sp. YH16039 TaxID=2601184 RepID=UPI0015D34409|nr:hypothetical protein [Acinetobacter sp. YH16039]
MKYKFLKLSVFSFTTCFLAVPVNADLVELNPNSNNVSEDRIEQLTRTLQQADSYLDSINIPPAISEPKSEITPTTIYGLRDPDSKVLLKNNRSRYNNLKVEKVTYYPDSSIHRYELPTWLINCEKKKFDHMKICYMNEGDLWVFIINGRYSVSVGSNHYPRSKGGLRIDNSSAIYGYEGELPKPLSLIEKLKKGKVAYTRYQEWPYEYNKDGEVSLKDFTKQFNEMLKQYKEL